MATLRIVQRVIRRTAISRHAVYFRPVVALANDDKSRCVSYRTRTSSGPGERPNSNWQRGALVLGTAVGLAGMLTLVCTVFTIY